jgi:hypothetical protein
MISPAFADLVVLQGATFDQNVAIEVNGSAYNMTGFTGTLLAKDPDATTAEVTLTTSDGIILGNGTMALSMTAVDTAALTPGRYPYQVEVNTGTAIVRILEGQLRIVPEITA